MVVRQRCGGQDSPLRSQPGQGHPGGGCEERPFARQRRSRREMSEGERVQARTPCPWPLTNPRESRASGGVLNAGPTKPRLLCPTVPSGSPSGGNDAR